MRFWQRYDPGFHLAENSSFTKTVRARYTSCSAFMITKNLSFLLVAVTLGLSTVQAADKPKLTLDEFFNSVSFDGLKLSPDGRTILIGAERADWDQNIFRRELWIYRDDGRGGDSLTPLTQSGHDTGGQWSPDGQWIAFLSERKLPSKDDDSGGDAKEGETTQLYLISPNGGEAFPVTRGEEDIHAFTWSADSRSLYFATRTPWTKPQKDAYKKEWKDVNQYRAAERGDQIFSLNVVDAVAGHAAAGINPADNAEDAGDATPGSHVLGGIPWHVEQLVASPDGHKLALVSVSVSERQEKVEESEIYSIDLAIAGPDHAVHQVTHNNAVEQNLAWSSDSRHIFFLVEVGDVSGPYRDLQPHLYWVDADSGEVQQWGRDFIGAVGHYQVQENRVLLSGRLGTEVALYAAEKPSDSFHPLNAWAGTYEAFATASHSGRIALVHSSLEKPAEVPTNCGMLGPSLHSTNCSPNVTCPRESRTAGEPMTVPALKGCSCIRRESSRRRICRCLSLSTVALRTPTGIILRRTGTSGTDWRQPRDGWCLSRTIADRPVTEISFCWESYRKLCPVRAKTFSKVSTRW
jgi:Tol biopolymer transport system component